MKALQKLTRNGNTTTVSIARPLLVHLGWLPGELVVVELLTGGRVMVSKHEPEKQLQVRLGSKTMLNMELPTE